MRISTRKISEPISRKEPFTTHGAVRGVVPRGITTGVGSLPVEFHGDFWGAEYVVYSYDTPILWFRDGTWYRPDVYYSNATRHHQGAAGYGAALSQREHPEEKYVDLTGEVKRVGCSTW